jgi:hypothetical protein
MKKPKSFIGDQRWAVSADPEHSGKHPGYNATCHEHRYVVSADAVWDDFPDRHGAVPLAKGRIIAQVRDLADQEEVAMLLASAPELLDSLLSVITAFEGYSDAMATRHKAGYGDFNRVLGDAKDVIARAMNPQGAHRIQIP